MPVFRAAGESAVYALFEQRISPEVSRQVHSFAAAVEAAALSGVSEVVPAYASALVYFDPAITSFDELVSSLAAVAEKAGAMPPPPPRHIEIPVCYGGEFGPDLGELARYAGTSEQEAVRLHAGRRYLVYCLGFSPGFAFMGTVDEKIALGRLPTPRAAVPAGSVGIAGRQTGIYPAATPGGWRIIGRTPVRLLFRAGAAGVSSAVGAPGATAAAPTAAAAAKAAPTASGEPPVLLRPGDEVSFRVISEAEFGRLRAEEAAKAAACGEPGPPGLAGPAPGRLHCADAIRVLSPGAFTTVQDEGRSGWQQYGFAPNGPADAESFRIANRLVGNQPGAGRLAALECTMTGPTLRFRRPAVVAVTGADMTPRLNGRPFPMWQANAVAAGDVLSLGSASPAKGGLRAYIAVRGGIDVPLFLGSRATDLAAGVGGLDGRPLRRGDVLPLPPLPPDGTLVDPRPSVPDFFAPEMRAIPPAGRPLFLRLSKGPDAGLFADEDLARFLAATFLVSSLLNRSGVRLEGGPELHLKRDVADPTDASAGSFAHVISKPMPLGAVQVPPDGQPIVLLAARPTLGGYPVIGIAPEPDVSRLAQASPGTAVRFVARESEGIATDLLRSDLLSEEISRLVAVFVRERHLGELRIVDDGAGVRVRLVRNLGPTGRV